MACLKLVYWLKAVSVLLLLLLCLLLLFFLKIFLFVRRHFRFFFTDVPEESMQNVNRIDCQH